jgi:hypothetical protein
MSMSVGASSNALAYLQQLLQQGTSGASSTGAADPLSELMQTLSGSGSGSDSPTSSTTDTAAGSGASGCQPFGTGTMAQLLSLQSQGANGTQGTNGPEQAFFSKLDTDGDGKISKTEFESAASKAGVDSSVADAVFDKIDGNSDGSVSAGELAKADHGGHHHHVHGGGGGGEGGGLDALMSGADASGATTKTTTNADGSSTTTISYADGTSIDLNMPAAAATSASTASDASSTDSSSTDSSASTTSGTTNSQTSFNLLEQLIKMQSQMLSAMQASTSTMSIAA